MANKRPSYVSIRARQRNIIEGLGTREDLNTKEVAKRLGVTPQELRRFRDTKPKELRKSFNRSPSIRKLYEEGRRSEVREKLEVPRIRRYAYSEPILREPRLQRHPNSKQVGRMIQRLYYENNIGPQAWSTYTYEHGLPNSIKAIKLLYMNDRITGPQYASILKHWRDSYSGMSDSYYANFADVLDEEDEEAA